MFPNHGHIVDENKLARDHRRGDTLIRDSADKEQLQSSTDDEGGCNLHLLHINLTFSIDRTTTAHKAAQSRMYNACVA